VNFFEGPEKRLEIDFKYKEENSNPTKDVVSAIDDDGDCTFPRLGMRKISREKWTYLLSLAKCSILSHMSNEYCDSFVLSESSLFVYEKKVILKTCGTTVLLNCVCTLINYANSVGMEVALVMFSRKNFLFPEEQRFPHTDWKQEVDFLNKTFDGTAYVLGPLTQEHWYLYLADYTDHSVSDRNEKTVELMMHNLHPDVLSQFFRKPGESSGSVKFPGMADLIRGSITDEFNFAPCGYSMNGLFGPGHYTIHVTPESHCSYASFETNVSLPSYGPLINHVLSIFRPGTVTVTCFEEKLDDHECEPFAPKLCNYVLRHKTFSELEGNCDITLCNYASREYLDSPTFCPKKQKVPPQITLGSDM